MKLYDKLQKNRNSHMHMYAHSLGVAYAAVYNIQKRIPEVLEDDDFYEVYTRLSSLYSDATALESPTSEPYIVTT